MANVAIRTQLSEVEDGVLWSASPEGLTALAVAPGSGAARAGVQPGDILLAVDGLPVGTAAELVELLHYEQTGSLLSYAIVRLGTQQALEVSVVPAASQGWIYLALATVGLFSLLVGASVRLRRPLDQATLHFFWLCVAFFGVFTFSFNGPLDRLDWVFYWGDASAMLLLPPLLLHLTLVFPERPRRHARLLLNGMLPLAYGLALVLGVAHIVTIAGSGGPAFSSAIEQISRAEHAYLSVCVLAAIAILFRAFQETTSATSRRQLRWIAWGALLGGGPFALGFALPWVVGLESPVAFGWTALPLGLVPLAFACAIVRYRLRDVEVIIKRGLGYATFLAASVALYVALEKLVGYLFANEGDSHTQIVALLATIVVVLLAQPVKEAIQDALDRVFYRSRYDYRRALVGFARDLNNDLDVERLSQRLVSRTVETLALDRMALMLADERVGDFGSIGAYGFGGPVAPLVRSSSFVPRLDEGHTVTLDDPMSAAWFAAEEVEFWRDQGIHYFVPCVFEGSAIAVLALGHKETDEPCSSEDLGLLTAVAGQVATAIENGRLYRQLRLKAEELGRMRELNENILESLDAGLIVFGADERILRWNRALESFYGISRGDAIGRVLGEVFDVPFVEGLRAALRENPRGAALFKVPLRKRSPGMTADTEVPQLLVNATVVPLQDSTGSDAVAGTILLVDDITGRVRLEEQLQISEKMASIGLLAAGVAHEVNTPLTGISSFTQMLLEGAEPGDPKTVLLEKIERQTFRAAKIVNGLLNLSRPWTPGGERTLLDLDTVISDVISLLEHQFAAARIKVRRELSPIPAAVNGIEHQLQQVFLNLFLNARDAMPSGGWLTVTTHVSGQQVTAEVADTGSGIPPEQLVRIYDPFFTTKAIGRGTGLGLSIAYGIVHEHDGSVRCQSSVGQGTRFAVTLPLAEPVARSVAN